MQNRAAIAANATQHEIIQGAAERQRLEDKAGKQLERVQQQMALFVMPVTNVVVRRRCTAHTHDTPVDCKPAKIQAISPLTPPRKECCP